MTGYNYVVTENNIYVHLREHLGERSKPEFVVSFITFEIVVRPAKSNFQPSVESNTRLLEPRGGPHCQRCKTHVSPPPGRFETREICRPLFGSRCSRPQNF